MPKNKNRCFKIFLLSVMLLCTMKVEAAEIEKYEGSISIQLEQKESKQLKIAKVARLEDGFYITEDGYKDTKIDLNTLQNANDLKQAAERYKEYVKDAKEVWTDSTGYAKVEQLDIGVYLVFGEDILPFLVSVPTWSEERKVMEYHIEVCPKYSSYQRAPQTGDSQSVRQLCIYMGMAIPIIIYSYRKKCVKVMQ